jgi:hypothetical protein
MDIWKFSTRLTRRLLIWSTLSVSISILTYFSADPFLRGLAIQFLAWGLADGGIALFGKRWVEKKKLSAQQEAKEARWLSLVLWINTGLDVLYVLGGVWLMQTWGADSPLWKGHGLGIVIQGGFLFFFDLYHAFSLRNLRIN